MAKRPYMPLFIDRWRGGTEAISPKHRGPYLDLLCAVWAGGGILKNDPRVLMSASRLNKRQFASFWDECAGKFLISDAEIRHAIVTEMLTTSDTFAAKMQQKRSRRRKKSEAEQGSSKQNSNYHTEGMVSSLREEKPYLPDVSDNSALPATPAPPSALEARGLVVTDHSRRVVDALKALPVGRVSTAELDHFRRAVQGERAGRVVLRPGYEPRAEIAAIIETTAPQLKAIEGGKP